MPEQNSRRQFLKTVSLLGVGMAAAGDGVYAAAPLTAHSASGGNTLQVSSGIAIQNAAIVNTRDGSIARGMTIVVDAGRIQRISPSQSVQISGTTQLIDASGKYVVPGYLDMHTHATATLANPPSDFPMLLANGVTGVREISGSPALIQRARQLNADIAAGRVDAPEVLVVPSDIFIGQQASDAAGAIEFVQQKKADGADFIKMTAGNREAFLAVLAEARRQGLTVAGHLIPAVSAREASSAGFYFEHLGAGWGLLLDCARDEESIRQDALSNPPPPTRNVINPRLFDGNWNAPYYQRIMDTYDEAKCQALAQTLVADGTWQTPTLLRIRTQYYGDDALYRADPNLVYIDKSRRALWEQTAEQFADTITPATRATLRQFYALQLRATQTLKQSGVKMLAGSDLGGGWVLPGFGLHQEFRELAAAGLPPLEILQMTTLNGAEFLGREATMGTVDEGKAADLVLLDDNPLADVANLSKIEAVFLKGKYFPRAALDKLKSDVAAAYAAQPIRDPSTALDLSHVC